MADALDRVFALTIERLADGSRELTVDVAAATVDDDMTYTGVTVIRKLREFPRSQTDGYQVWASALTPAALTDTFEDGNLPEGEHAYYALFAFDADGNWVEKAREDKIGADPRFEEVSGSMYPERFLIDSGLTVNSTAVLKEAMADAAFGDVESLIRQLSVQQDPDRCGLLALSMLCDEHDWPLGPADDLIDARETLKTIKETMRSRGTEEVEDELLAQITFSTVNTWRGLYYWTATAGGLGNERDWRLSAMVEGVDVGGGDFQYADTLEVSPQGIRPYSVLVTVDASTEYTDDGAGTIVDSGGAPVGTVDYDTGALDVTVPSGGFPADVEYSVIVRPTTAGAGWCSDAVVARRGFLTASDFGVEAEVAVDVMLDSRSFDAALTADVARKIRKFWSIEGKNVFVLSVTAIVTGDADELIGRLPIEDERGANYGYAQRADMVQG